MVGMEWPISAQFMTGAVLFIFFSYVWGYDQWDVANFVVLVLVIQWKELQTSMIYIIIYIFL